MKDCQIKNVLRDAIQMAKEKGLWQMLTLREKENLVKYFYTVGGCDDDRIE